MTDRQLTCAERIEGELEDTLNRVRLANAWQHVCENPDCGHEWTDDEEDPYECPQCASEGVDDEGEEAFYEIDSEESEERLDVIECERLTEKWRVGLSCGGPADGFYVYINPQDRTIDEIEYYYQDWFDGAKRYLRGEDFELVRNWLESNFYFGE